MNQPHPWEQAVRLVEGFTLKSAKADRLLQDWETVNLERDIRRCQYLFFGVLRHRSFLQQALSRQIRRKPRPVLQAVLLVAGFEILDNLDDAERHPKIVHYAVEQAVGLCSRGEAGLVNAVLRLLPDSFRRMREELSLDKAQDLAALFSHPQWLVKRWCAQFGEADTVKLLNWNQRPPERTLALSQRAAATPPKGLEPLEVPGFFRIGESTDREALQGLLDRGEAYIRDPSTAGATDLADVQQGERVLDLCSAPGGKARAILEREPSRVVAVDRLSGGDPVRRRHWEANLNPFSDRVTRIVCDILDPEFPERLSEEGEGTAFDVVLIDVPCSNTGVIRRRPDVRWRLEPSSVAEMVGLQRQLLPTAAAWVRPGGRLVYSTCSLEEEENGELVKGFLATEAGQAFTLEKKRVQVPWVDGYDGAGAFLLRRFGG